MLIPGPISKFAIGCPPDIVKFECKVLSVGKIDILYLVHFL